MKTADLKKYAFDLLDLSRRFLSEDGDLDPTAFIVTADDQLLRTIDLTDEAHKVSSCEKIVQEARQRTALAIITIFLARFEDFNQKEFDSESYSWGEIQDKSSKRCILLSVSGPGVKNWAVALPFENIDGRFVFGGRVEFKGGVDLGLFPGWSEQVSSPNAC